MFNPIIFFRKYVYISRSISLFRFLGYYEYVGRFYTTDKNRKNVDTACGKAFGK